MMTLGRVRPHPGSDAGCAGATKEYEMTMTSELHSSSSGPARTAGGRTSWLGAGVGVLGLVASLYASAGFSVVDKLPVATMLQKLEDAASGMRVSGGLQALTAFGLVLFGAHIRHLLLRREPEGSLTPSVAWGGALLAAAMTATAGAITQLSVGYTEAVDSSVPLTLHSLDENLYAGAWCAIALVAGAVAVAGLRRGAVPRWFAGLSAFVATLLVVAQLAVPWIGWFPALVWVIVSAFALRERA
jgi:hypothetical protein